MQRKSFEDPIILFAPAPDLKDLCSLTVRVESNRPTAGFITTQPKILKCREFIFTEPDIIASPSFEQNDCFTLILTQALFRTGRIQARLKNNNLQGSKAYRVQPGLYQSCLQYTMLAKLAPAWNKAGDWLIQGRDFLTHRGRANAVKCEVVSNTEELYLSVCGAVLRLVPLQLADLNLSDLEVQTLLYNAEHGSGELALHNAWCRVLPSLKKARLCSISLCVPEDSPFSSYKDLKRHWKNTYGFRLPDTDDDVFYAQISFWGLGGKQFTYPNVCLRAEAFQCLPRVEPKPILSAFLQDLHSKMPSACGHTLRFQPQMRHTVPALYSAAQNTPGPGPNLSKRSVQGGSQVALRDPRPLVLKQANDQQTTSSRQLPLLKAAVHSRRTDVDSASDSHSYSTVSQHPSSHHANTPAPLGEQDGIKWSQLPKVSVAGDKGSSADRPQPSKVSVAPDGRRSADFPLRKDKTGENLYGEFKTINASPLKKGGERAEKRRPTSSRGNAHQGQSSCLVTDNAQVSQTDPKQNVEEDFLDTIAPTQTEPDSTRATIPPKIVPVFRPKTLSAALREKQIVACTTDRNASQNTGTVGSRIVPTFLPKLGKSSNQVKTTATTHNNSSSISCQQVTSSTGDSLPPFSQSFPPPVLPASSARKPSFPKVGKSSAVKSTGPQTPQGRISMAGKLKQKMDLGIVTAGLSRGTTETRPPASPLSSPWTGSQGASPQPFSGSQGKRKMDNQAGGEKKVRSKPQVQDLDVEMLARDNQLNKANAVTLMTWLKDRGVQCKCKDKKADLVERVNVFLAMTSSEP